MRKFGFNLLLASIITVGTMVVTAVTILPASGPGPCCFQ